MQGNEALLLRIFRLLSYNAIFLAEIEGYAAMDEFDSLNPDEPAMKRAEAVKKKLLALGLAEGKIQRLIARGECGLPPVDTPEACAGENQGAVIRLFFNYQ